MRRSSAPSQRASLPSGSAASASPYQAQLGLFRRPVLAPRQEGTRQPSGNEGGPSKPSAASSTFGVVWCKSSGRKHKKWEDDAVLVVRPADRLAVLRTPEGKEICRGSGMAISQLEGLGPGDSISFAGRDVEIVDCLSAGRDSREKEGHVQAPPQCTSQEEPPNPQVQQAEITVAPSTPRFHRPQVLDRAVFRPFAVPSKSGHGELSTPTGTPVQREAKSLFSADRADALVLPRPPFSMHREGVQLVDVVVDPHISSRLRPHQREGVTFLYRCVMGFGSDEGCTGAILADEMGLGKTLQTIALVWTLLRQGPWAGRPVVRRVLILTPSSLVRNWQAEFTKWLGSERINVFAVDGANKTSEYIKYPQAPVLIMSYEMFVRNFDDLTSHVSFDLLVCDEGHRLKNEKIKVSTRLAELEVDRRVVLTGTPLQNDLREFFALVGVVNPNILGGQSAFVRRYEDPIVRSRQPDASEEEREEGELRLEELNVVAGKFILRRTQDIISKYLPPKVEYVLFCRPTRTQCLFYRRLLDGLDLTCVLDNSCVLASITQLRKVCNHPSTLDDYDPDTVPSEIAQGEETFEAQGSKLAVVSSILHHLRNNGDEKIVLVSISTKVLDLLEELCRHYGYTSCRLDGSTPAAQRQTIVNGFNSPHSRDFVMLLSSKAGGTGLNLIGASRILLFDMDWNPANDAQAMARVWRDGQKRQVHVYRLVTAGSIEEKIFQRQVTKQGLGDGLVDGGKSLKGSGKQEQFHFSKEDLRDLFSFNKSASCDTHELLNCKCQDPDGDPTEHRASSSAVLDHRRCQLGGDPPSESAERDKVNQRGGKKKSIGDLMMWEHLEPMPELFMDSDTCLSAVLTNSCDISFILRNVHCDMNMPK